MQMATFFLLIVTVESPSTHPGLGSVMHVRPDARHRVPVGKERAAVGLCGFRLHLGWSAAILAPILARGKEGYKGRGLGIGTLPTRGEGNTLAQAVTLDTKQPCLHTDEEQGNNVVMNCSDRYSATISQLCTHTPWEI